MIGTGFFPLGREEAYSIPADELFLVGTSEVPLVTHALRRRRSTTARLPIKYAGISPCFRREAGAHGKDTRGPLPRPPVHEGRAGRLLRARRGASPRRMHYELLGNAEAILAKLEIPYRVALACTGEIGLGQTRKHEVESWMPGRNAYSRDALVLDARATSRRAGRTSASRMAGRLARRTRTRSTTPPSRARASSIPLLENHQNADGTVTPARGARAVHERHRGPPPQGVIHITRPLRLHAGDEKADGVPVACWPPPRAASEDTWDKSVPASRRHGFGREHTASRRHTRGGVRALRASPRPPTSRRAPADAARRRPPASRRRSSRHGTGKDHPTASTRVKVHYTGWTTERTDVRQLRHAGRAHRRSRAELGHRRLDRGLAAHGGRREAPAVDPGGPRVRRAASPGQRAGRRPRVRRRALSEIVAAPKPPAVPEDVEGGPASAKKTASGLAYRVLTPGTGARLTQAATTSVTVNYTGWTPGRKDVRQLRSPAASRPASRLDWRHQGLDGGPAASTPCSWWTSARSTRS